MNQILNSNIINKKININGYKKPYIAVSKKPIKHFIYLYKGLLGLSICVIVVCVSYAIQDYINKNKMENLAKNLANTFSISTLYSQNNSYTATELNNYAEDSNFSVIGLIKIDAIQISYSILSNISDELLKISPCRFYGPMPNEVGNMCIAAHNYDDNRFFSKIKKLKNGDIIYIYDSKRTLSYIFYI